MAEITEKDIEKLNQGRLLREASRELLPLLLSMKETVIARIILAHRGNEAGQLPALAAELSVLGELTTKINKNNRETEKREDTLYATGE